MTSLPSIARIQTLLIVLGFLAAVFVLMSSVGPFAAAFGCTVVLLGCMLLGRPSTLLLLYWLGVGLAEGIQTFYHFPRFQGAVKLLIVLLSAVMLFGDYAMKRRSLPRDIKGFHKVSMLLLLLALVSAVVNLAPVVTAAWFVLSYLAFIPIFHIAYLHSDIRTCKFMCWMLVAVMLVQLVCNVGWLVGVNPVPNFRIGTVDFAVGTFGSSTYVAYLSLAVIFIMMPLLTGSDALRYRLVALGVMAIAAVQLYITSTTHAYIVLGMGLALQFFATTRRFKGRWFVPIVIGVSAVLVLATENEPSRAQSSAMIGFQELSPGKPPDALAGHVSGPKGEAFQNVVLRAAHEMPFFPIGAGPGNFASSIGCQAKNPLAQKYINYFFETFTGRQQMFGDSISQQVVTGFLAIWSELGPIGVLLFFGLHVYALRRVWRQVAQGRYEDRYRPLWRQGS